MAPESPGTVTSPSASEDGCIGAADWRVRLGLNGAGCSGVTPSLIVTSLTPICSRVTFVATGGREVSE